MTQTDVLVVGAGPAGLSAAIEARRAGLDVTVIDENAAAGGQIYRQLPRGFAAAPTSQPAPEGRRLIEQCVQLNVRFRFGCTAWGLFEPGIMEVSDAHGTGTISARRIVLATGAYDRVVPVPGWTLPGVFTVGGAQALLKSQRVLAAERVLLAGVGPLLLVVAAQLHSAGAKVLAVVEPASSLAPIGAVPFLAREPRLLSQGLGYRWSLIKGRVPWRSRTVLVKVEGNERVEAAVLCRVDREWRPIKGTETRLAVDAVCIGYGLIPSIELARICGCAVTYERSTRTWVPVRNDTMESTVPGLFIAGDGAGIAGALVASHEGAVSGLAAAHQLGRLTRNQLATRLAPHRRRLAALEHVRRGMDRAYALGDGLYELATANTVICRCEEVTLQELEDAVQDGACDLSTLKSFTHCGMGPCQGRMCTPAVAEWLARRLKRMPDEIGLPSVAPPTKPVVALGAL